MKTMIIGLSPEYNYPGAFEKWRLNNTYFASNHGASFISRALVRQLDAEYIDDFTDISALRNQYDTCVLALSTHIHSKRDISYLADIVEKLDMKTVAPSLGMEDYIAAANHIVQLHPSVVRLLRLVSDRSEAIGVRGPHTQSVLQRHGFENVVPIGCPTLQWQLTDRIDIQKNNKVMNKPLIAYHRAIAQYAMDAMKSATILGQDFLDEAIFTNNRNHDDALYRQEMSQYQKIGNYQDVFAAIQKNGIFPNRYDLWFDLIGTHRFVIGARLHGCIAAIAQGVPAVLVPRDLRMKEIADFYHIPTVSCEELKTKTLQQLYEEVDFSKFKKTYKDRYQNYLNFLEMNKLDHRLEQPSKLDAPALDGSLKEISLKLTFSFG